MEEECFLVQLPKDVLIYKIFMELDSLRDVIALQLTCKYLYNIGQEEEIWKVWSNTEIKVIKFL